MPVPLSQEGAPDVQAARQDLLEMLGAYTEVANRLQESHQRLQGEVTRLREELAAKNRELRRRERLASLGQMAAGLAHEIRNPLGAIALYATMLEQDLVQSPEQVQTVRKIATAVNGLNRLVTNILEFARSREPSRRMVAFSQVLSLALPTVAALLETRKVDLRLPRQDVTLFADAEDLARAIGNLLRNSVEAVELGGHIVLQMRSAGRGAAVLWVEDDGMGVAPELAERVFEPFVTTRHSGTGLGLAIVHQIVEAHGGRIRLRRSRLGGAKFSLRIGPQPQERTRRTKVTDDGSITLGI